MTYVLIMLLFFADGTAMQAETVVSAISESSCGEVAVATGKELQARTLRYACILQQDA